MTLIDPDLLLRDAISALRSHRPEDALELLDQITAAGRGNAAVWLAVAMTHNGLGNPARELAALNEALKLEPRNLRALIMTGDNLAAAGDGRAACIYYDAVGKIAAMQPPADQGLAAQVTRARRLALEYGAEFENHLLATMAAEGVDQPGARRVRESLDLMLGKRQIYLQQPRHYYFPELPNIAWAERAAFPWLAEVEAATDAIRGELGQVLQDGAAFAPYLEPEPNRPVFAETRGMLDNPAWSSFYLWKSGAPVPENIARCPSVMAALENAPLCKIAGRTPSVFFSLLQPGAHIQPHHGFTNARYICHLPLIVPDGCAMRVGAETRPWAQGEACIFDDSIEHEAWNKHPDALRVVLIFDIWRPELRETERSLVSTLLQAVDSYRSPPRSVG
ncbi:MAG: aspartyl/asparaginyl beta-hydroxylase domain-containing protein [Phenylobacterium sp.]|nr:MAG: aspartyl/asparaginyl beta-hydroxylase domain-containing protein [Phenylobacterium sp.]